MRQRRKQKRQGRSIQQSAGSWVCDLRRRRHLRTEPHETYFGLRYIHENPMRRANEKSTTMWLLEVLVPPRIHVVGGALQWFVRPRNRTPHPTPPFVVYVVAFYCVHPIFRSKCCRRRIGFVGVTGGAACRRLGLLLLLDGGELGRTSHTGRGGVWEAGRGAHAHACELEAKGFIHSPFRTS